MGKGGGERELGKETQRGRKGERESKEKKHSVREKYSQTTKEEKHLREQTKQEAHRNRSELPREPPLTSPPHPPFPCTHHGGPICRTRV